MAGNVQADASGDILVEFDYNNIILVDPNKTIDKYNKVAERLVDHESLVMYVNLEADVIPRTKLAVGGAQPQIQTISVAKINFLKPNDDTYLKSSYYDELTGNNSVNLKGQNQSKQIIGNVTVNGKSYQTVNNSIVNPDKVIDNGLLGITQVTINTDSSFIPSVRIEMEDVQGKALFQLGDNSPYSAFFNLPHPQFYLTIKGYYGQAVRYQLNLEKFNSRFNTFSGNYQISLDFKGYKFNILNEISMGHLLAAPHMYSQTYNITSNPQQLQNVNTTSQVNASVANVIAGNASNSQNNISTQITSERGYEKIKEVFSEYKSKGLVPADLPEITLVQLMNSLESFENQIIDSYPKANLVPLTDIRTYKTNLKTYYEKVRGTTTSSWFNKYLNPTPFVLENGDFVYIFKKNYNYGQRQNAISELNSIVTNNNNLLLGNQTLGKRLTINISEKTFKIDVTENPIDWRQSYLKYYRVFTATDLEVSQFEQNYINLVIPTEFFTSKDKIEPIKVDFFIFESTDRFDKEITRLESEANKILSEYEAAISADLANRLQDKSTGIGFKPTVRNLVGIIMASAEGFIRLMDEVHTNAWNVKYDPIRKNAILNNPSSAQSSDAVNLVPVNPFSSFFPTVNQNLLDGQTPVYPWPQFFVENNDSNKNRFELTYIGDPSVVNLTKGYLFEKWPEVEFVEEYMRGLTQKFNPPVTPPPLENQRDTNQMNLNAIEYPQLGISYTNKNEVRFFYEIWERQFLTSHYSGLNRINNNLIDQIVELNSTTEAENVKNSLGISSPSLTYKLKNYNFNATNYENDVLKNFSNEGTGKSYQDYIRDFFVTGYIKGVTENPFSILSVDDIGKNSLNKPNQTPLQTLVKGTYNEPTIADTLPFSDPTWVQSNMAGSNKNQGNLVYNTNNSLFVASSVNLIANFDGDIYKYNVNRPVTNFSYLQTTTNPTPTNSDMSAFYLNRSITINSQNFIPTEGYCTFTSSTNSLNIIKTTSILNTPYFVNAIQKGVNSQKNSDPYPYIEAAYLFINSLPIATLKEKYKTFQNNATTDLDYIASVFNKFGAIHKIPYAWVLKLGSVWYRYKKYIETNVDILDTVWTNFDYIENYSPLLNTESQTYSFNYEKTNISITLQSETPTTADMQIGFYPKLINDFNYFYNGYIYYTGYTSEEIQQSINQGVKLYNFGDSNMNSVNLSGKTFNQKTWSVVIPEIQLLGDEDECDPVDNTANTGYYIVPSFGTNVNQGYVECVNNKQSTVDATTNLLNNPNIYNGSVRTLWAASNYGYFDNSQAQKPLYNSYLNRFNSDDIQPPFSILSYDGYSKMEEIFAVFDKSQLDLFEQEFLNFSKPGFNISLTTQISQFNQSNVDIDYTYKNFQILFKSLMSVPRKVNQTEDDYFKNLINLQLINFSNTIKGFMQYDVIIRNGNPSKYERRIFDSYRSYNSTVQYVTNPIKFNSYVVNSLPSNSGAVPLAVSKTLFPEAWKALETEVGFSTIDNVRYSDNGSYFTDFFIDNNIEFTKQNVELLAPLIKMYATEKLRQPATNANSFKQSLTNYLNRTEELQNNFLNQTLTRIRRILPQQSELPERTINSIFDSQQSKIENYEMFKALNDKWIAGGDFSERTLFEDFLFLDRASRNIGDKILINIFDLKNVLSKKALNQAMSVQTFIFGILIQNNFTVMNLPAYVNFYNVQDVNGTSTPRPEGSLEFANNLWGTFLNVDYRKSSPKMVCFFVGKPSEYLALPKGNFKFNDDGLEISRVGKNPLIEDQTGKTDWALSNKCVGFNVDIGIKNQNVFKAFSVAQDPGLATSEAINAQLQIVDQGSGRLSGTQNVGLYNFYKLRSYKCEVVSFGNAMLQPTMYFNLRHVPMFNGPYFITSVQHSIQVGQFETTFTGVRQSVFDLPSIDNFLQQINQNLLTRLQELVKTRKDTEPVQPTTNEQKANSTIQNSKSTKDTENSCIPNLYYTEQVSQPYVVKESVPTEITEQEFVNALKTQIAEFERLRLYIYLISYVRSFKVSKFSSFNNNYVTLSLDDNFSPTDTYFDKTYSCVNLNGRSTPIANFSNLTNFIKFMADRIRPNVDRIITEGVLQYYVCNWPKNGRISQSYYYENVGRYDEVKGNLEKGLKSAVQLGLVSYIDANEIVKGINEDSAKGKTPGSTPTPSQVPLVLGQPCPPPLLESFSPSVGLEGMIIQINGRNLESVTGITITPQVNTLLPIKVTQQNITIFNDETLRFNLPFINTNVKIPTSIFVDTQYGSSSGTTFFYYDPLMNTMPQSANPSMTDSTSPPPQNSVNTQPQQTGPITMSSTSVELNPRNTESLVVNINQQVSGWTIKNEVEMRATYYTTTYVNNIAKPVLANNSTTTISGYTVGGTQFKIDNTQVLNELQTKFPNVPIDKTKTDIAILFILTAEPPIDPNSKNQPVQQSFQFKLGYSTNTPSVANVPITTSGTTYPLVPITISSVPGETSTPFGNGKSFYNVVNERGSYNIYKLNVPDSSQYQNQNIPVLQADKPESNSMPIVIKSNGNPANYTITSDENTGYTYVITMNEKGAFRIIIPSYKPYGNTSPNGGQVLTQRIEGPIFTI